MCTDNHCTKVNSCTVQLVQELKPQAATQRLDCVNQATEPFSANSNILFLNEAHSKPKHQKALNSPRVTIWTVTEITGSYVFEHVRERTVSVNSERYVKLLDRLHFGA